MNKKANTFILITVTLLGHGAIAHGASILTSKHNLSTSGLGAIKASGESQVCIFCHTPHNARQDIPYLWNRSAQTTNYTPYNSSTMFPTIVGQPTGASKLCLSCHDGTIALGAVLSEPTPISFIGANTLSGRSTSLATDLSNDHPVSFNYQSSITSGNTELVAASTLIGSPVQLDSTGQLQCTACHDPHDDAFGKFLVMSNQGSALCITCHTKSGWAGSTHATSILKYSGTGVNPLPNATTTVAENACGNCHRPHTAGRHQRLLKQVKEEDNCLACHSGQVATQSNIASELTKIYRHPVGATTGAHDAAEDFKAPGGVTKHVVCEDCHNPHQVKNTTAVAPLVSGRNTGVQGITAAGLKTTNASNLYEICFKCHADAPNNVITTAEITRKFPQVNTRLEFLPGNPSSHRVEPGGSSGAAVPSLLTPTYTNTSILYCTDCHGSETAPPTGAKGPHGSRNKHLLVANYITADGPESASAYALCYKCHNRNNFAIQQNPENLHWVHVVDAKTSCATCHDPHSSSGYNRLINFNTGVVQPFNGVIAYSGGVGTSPQCTLSCHGRLHDRLGQGVRRTW